MTQQEWAEQAATTIIQQDKRISELEALVIAAAQADDAKDAARYRWIREHAKRDGRDGGWWGYYVLPMLPGWDGTPYSADRGEGYDHKTLDEAVDAAMKVNA